MKGLKLVIAVWVLSIVSGSFLDHWHEKQFLPPAEERTADDVLVDVFGEVKTVVARYLWFRMDLFHEALDDADVPAAQQSEVLPLLRMVTLLDPGMTDSYDQIVWDLYIGHGKREEAFDILDEGLRRNPNNYQLRFRKALLMHMEDRHKECFVEAAKALQLTQDEVQQADSLRLIYWSAKSVGRKDVQGKALADLIKLRPKDPLWKREKALFESGATSTPSGE